MYSISKLAQSFNLSRSTLLYYDKIGLLKPMGRSRSNYREYSQADYDRLAQICIYRQAGLSLDAINALLNAPNDSISPVLEQRLMELDAQIRDLQSQQRFIISLLMSDRSSEQKDRMDSKKWVEFVSRSGLDEQQRLKWHQDFERLFPDKHQQFLESLGMSEKDIKVIRERSTGRDLTGL